MVELGLLIPVVLIIAFVVMSGYMALQNRSRETNAAGQKLGFTISKGCGQFQDEIRKLGLKILNPFCRDLFFFKQFPHCRLAVFPLYHKGPPSLFAVIEPSGNPWPDFHIFFAAGRDMQHKGDTLSSEQAASLDRLLAPPVSDLVGRNLDGMTSKTLLGRNGKIYYHGLLPYKHMPHFMEEADALAQKVE